MHEFNICQTIVDTVLTQIDATPAQSGRLVKTTVVIGRLRQIVPDYLVFAYDTLIKDTAVEGSRLEIKVAPIIFSCEQCGENTEMNTACFKCQKCGSNQGQVSGGRELYLESLEIEDNE